MFGKNKDQDPDLEFFTIFDSKSKSYENPTFAPNKNVLIREIINMFKDPKESRNKFLLNAEDYSIFKIASYDKKTGQVAALQLEHVANMHDLRAIAQPGALSPT